MQTYNPGLLSDRTSIQSLWSRPVPSVPHIADSSRRMVSSPHYVGSEVLSFKCKNQYGLPLLKFFENPDILINGRGWAPSSCPPLSSGLISMVSGTFSYLKSQHEPSILVSWVRNPNSRGGRAPSTSHLRVCGWPCILGSSVRALAMGRLFRPRWFVVGLCRKSTGSCSTLKGVARGIWVHR